MNDAIIKFNDLEKVTALHGTEIEEAVNRVLRSGWYLHGAETERFEEAYAGFIGTRHAVGVASGLDALWLIMRGLIETGKLRRGDEVIVPANTFIATILAITDNGLRPVLAEPNPVTMELDAASLRSAMTSRTRAVMTVHLYGRCAWDGEMERICRDNGLIVLEDNAQAQGCRCGERRTGSLGLAAAHSFYPGKNLGALGDAGAVTTNDNELEAAIRAIANYGSQSKYVFRYQGRNSRLDELNAAVLSVKLAHLDTDNNRRREIAAIYMDEIRHPDVILPPVGNPEENVWHIFPLRADRRDELQKHLADCGVQTIIHYPVPPHKQECYSEWNALSLPITERLAATELSLPMSSVLTDDEARRVAEAVNSWQH